MGVARITLCLIAKDEERMLPDCLASVRDAVDEIVIVDTGSVDGTRRLARAAGARLAERPWRDFADARNAALAMATGDFVLQLDADERLAAGAGAALRRVAAEGDLDVAMLWLHDASCLDAAPEEVLTGRSRIGPPFRIGRFFRRLAGLSYRGAVHESLDDSLVKLGVRIGGVEAHIVHLGNVPALRAALGKDERNLVLLRRRCAEEAGDVTAFGYLALELVERGEVVEGARVAERGWARLEEQPRHRSVHRLALARAAAALALREPARALDSVHTASERMGRRVDFDFLEGAALEALALEQRPGPGRVALAREAAAAHARAAERDAAPTAEQLVHQASRAGCAERQGCALLVAGEPARALAAFEAALALAPGSEGARLGEAEARVRLGEPRRALSSVEPLLGRGPDAWIIAAAAAREIGDRDTAGLLLARARERAQRGFMSAHRCEALGAAEGS